MLISLAITEIEIKNDSAASDYHCTGIMVFHGYGRAFVTNVNSTNLLQIAYGRFTAYSSIEGAYIGQVHQ